MNMKEILNLNELPSLRWWADRSILHLMQRQYCIGSIVFIMGFVVIVFIMSFVIIVFIIAFTVYMMNRYCSI